MGVLNLSTRLVIAYDIGPPCRVSNTGDTTQHKATISPKAAVKNSDFLHPFGEAESDVQYNLRNGESYPPKVSAGKIGGDYRVRM